MGKNPMAGCLIIFKTNSGFAPARIKGKLGTMQQAGNFQIQIIKLLSGNK